MDPSRLTNLPSSATIKQTSTSDDSAPSAAEQKKVQPGIASVKDSFESKQQNSIFTANPNTGEVNFGDGLSGKRPPIGGENVSSSYNRTQHLLDGTKAEISSFLKGHGGTASSEVAEPFGSLMEYMKLVQKEAKEDRTMRQDFKESSMLAKEAQINVSNNQIDQQMKEAREKADILMHAANTQMTAGVVGGVLSIGSAAAGIKQMAAIARSEISEKSTEIEDRYKRFNSLVSDLEKATVDPRSDSKRCNSGRTRRTWR